MVYTGALQRDYERLNMMTLQEFLEKQFDENLMLAVLSGQRSKEKEAPSKVRIRQIELKGSVCYQASSTVGTKVLHSNYSREEVIAYVEVFRRVDFPSCRCREDAKMAVFLSAKRVK